MKRVSAHVAAASVLVTIGLVFSAVGVLAKDNPGNHYGRENNPGNHYGQLDNPGNHFGQLKHAPPPPVAAPPPQPVTNATAPGGTPLVVVQASVPGLTDGGASSLPDLPVSLPPQSHTSGRSASPGDGLEWLILLVLPSLLAVWAIAVARIAMTATKRRRAAHAALVAAPNAT
jgi:hypothetical protein